MKCTKLAFLVTRGLFNLFTTAHSHEHPTSLVKGMFQFKGNDHVISYCPLCQLPPPHLERDAMQSLPSTVD